MRLSITLLVLLLFTTEYHSQTLSAWHSWVNPDELEMTLSVTVDTETNQATLVMTGPENEWFAYGFGQSQMAGTYAIIAEMISENTVVSERMLANHAAGSQLTSNRISTDILEEEGKRTVTIVVPASGENAFYDFPSEPQNISFITAVGFGGSLGFHGGENYALGNQNNASALMFTTVVPVTWSSFTIKNQGSLSHLRWETSSEVNNAGFYVQRSMDGKEWMDIHFLPAKSERGGIYEYVDPETAPGINYYRLRQVDLDGTENFSVIKSIEIRGSDDSGDILLFPNPVKDFLSLKKEESQGPKRIQIMDMKYRVVVDEIWQENLNQYQADVSNLTPGHYLIMVKHSDWGFTSHFIKQ